MSQNKEQTFGYKKEVGSIIQIYFNDRRVLTGKLLATNDNELFLEVKGMEVTIFKHAVKYIVNGV